MACSRRTRFVAVLISGVAAPFLVMGEDAATIQSNFEYRQSWGDLGEPGSITADPSGSRRALRVGRR